MIEQFFIMRIPDIYKYLKWDLIAMEHRCGEQRWWAGGYIYKNDKSFIPEDYFGPFTELRFLDEYVYELGVDTESFD